MKKNLIRLATVDKKQDFPVARATLYKWRTTRVHPEIFIKFGGAVFVDLDKLDEALEAGRGAR
jgi:hypothetical protein